MIILILKEKRKELGVSADEMAVRMEVSERQVWYWEKYRNNPRADKLLSIMKHYHLSVDELMEYLKECEEHNK